jgi:ArsR family transcriptional regulator
MMNQIESLEKASDLLSSIGHSARMQILLALGSGEACVCHIESHLGLRQAYISQQLMILRRKKIILTRRAGKFIYYRLANPEILGIIQAAGSATGDKVLKIPGKPQSRCACPKCNQD